MYLISKNHNECKRIEHHLLNLFARVCAHTHTHKQKSVIYAEFQNKVLFVFPGFIHWKKKNPVFWEGIKKINMHL